MPSDDENSIKMAYWVFILFISDIENSDGEVVLNGHVTSMIGCLLNY